MGSVQRISARALHATIPKREEKPAAVSSGYFSDYRIQLPIGFLVAVPLLEHQVYVISEETQLLGCFMIFVATIYTQAGDAIGKFFDNKALTIMADQRAQEDIAIGALRKALVLHQQNLSLAKDMKIILASQAEVKNTLAAAKTIQLQHKTRASVVKQLDYLVQKEEQLKSATQAFLIAGSTKAVKDAFLNDKKLQSSALSAALESIVDPTKKSTGDVVGSVYSKFFNDYVSSVKAKKGVVTIPTDIFESSKDEILALRKKIGKKSTDTTKLSKTLEY